MRAILIDDSPSGIEALKWKLEESAFSINVEATFTNPYEALVFLTSNPIDIVFSDIEMPGMTGLELIGKVRNIDHEIQTIFVTAHDKYVLQALRNEALDYIQKPIDPDELNQALLRLYTNSRKKEPNSKIALATAERVHYVFKDDILYCIADGNYTSIYMKNGEIIVLSKNLQSVYEMLNEPFLRIHRSHFIHSDHVTSFSRGIGGTVTMRDGKSLPISKSLREATITLLKGESF